LKERFSSSGLREKERLKKKREKEKEKNDEEKPQSVFKLRFQFRSDFVRPKVLTDFPSLHLCFGGAVTPCPITQQQIQ
jgi:hypothetical protein